MDIKYTSRLEEDLDEIAAGKKKYLEVVSSVYEILQKHIKNATGGPSIEAAKTGSKCTVCKEGDIVEKDGKYGKFYCCDRYPSCKSIFIKSEWRII